MRKFSSNYCVLARKYRPNSFSDNMVGQEPMVQTMTNAFKAGRIAQAYILSGIRGVGKTTTARIIARSLNYKKDKIDIPTIDFKVLGDHCQEIMNGHHIDVVELDAASHTGIDDIREIIENMRYKPILARYKVYIIDEVHMLSTAAFNGLLKTLEEPPSHVKFIFATTEIRKVPMTILSRCQRFDLRRIPIGDLVALFTKILEKESIEFESEAIAMIARASDGSARDGLSLLDQAIARGSGRVQVSEIRLMLSLSDRNRIIDLFGHLTKGDITRALQEFSSQCESGASPAVVLSDLADFTHLVTKIKYVSEMANSLAHSETENKRSSEYAKELSVTFLSRFWQMLLKGMDEVESFSRPSEAVEMVLIRLAHAAHLPSPEEIAHYIKGEKQEVKRAGSSGPVSVNISQSSTMDRKESKGIIPCDKSSVPEDAKSGFLEKKNTSFAKLKPHNLDEQRATDEFLGLCQNHHDYKIKDMVQKFLRVVSFKKKKLEVFLSKDAPADFLKSLLMKLKDWTGEDWMIRCSLHNSGEEYKDIDKGFNFENFCTDVDIQATRAVFPEARIVGIRTFSRRKEEK
nr:DNA polymerase III subunit gamma/tau [Candidatus Liberibacter sp.]